MGKRKNIEENILKAYYLGGVGRSFQLPRKLRESIQKLPSGQQIQIRHKSVSKAFLPCDAYPF